MTDQPSVRSVPIQCNLLAIPPLQKHEDILSDSKAESITRKPEDTARPTRHIKVIPPKTN